MSIIKLHLLLTTASAIITTAVFAGPGPGSLPTGFPAHVESKEEALACCRPGEEVTLACKDCKTAIVKDGEKEKKSILSWFAPDDKHDCSGCGGKMTLKQVPAGKGTAVAIGDYTHRCRKCGDDSAFTCATHKG